MCVHALHLNVAKQSWAGAGLEEHEHLDSLQLSSEGFYHRGQAQRHVLGMVIVH